MIGRVLGRLILAVPLLIGVGVLMVAAHRADVLADLYGKCPAPSIDPTSICYDPGAAAAAKAAAALRDSLKVAALKAQAAPCWQPGTSKRVPASAVMRAPDGTLAVLPFKVAWQAAAHGSWTLAVCAGVAR